MITIGQRMVTLQRIGQFYRFFFDNIFAPGQPGDRIHRVHIDGMHDTGKGNPGNTGNINPIILIGITLNKGIFFHGLNGMISITEKLMNIIVKISITKTELITLYAYCKRGVNDGMFNDIVLPNTASEFWYTVNRF